MTVAEKLKILNAIEVIDDDCNKDSFTVWVDLQTPILEAMREIGMTNEEIVAYVKENVDISDDVPYLDLAPLAFSEKVSAGWYFTGSGFQEEKPWYVFD